VESVPFLSEFSPVSGKYRGRRYRPLFFFFFSPSLFSFPAFKVERRAFSLPGTAFPLFQIPRLSPI